MAALIITQAAALVLCDAFVDRFDVNTPGTIIIYGDTAPTDADTAIGAQTLLATLTFAATAFGNAADAGPGAIATANAIVDDTSADATDTATWFRCTDGNALESLQGDVGTSGADLNLNTTSIVTGATVSITSMTITMPES